VRLVACQRCRAHIDVTRVTAAEVRCACGATVENRLPEALDLPVHRCAACGAALETDAATCGYCHAAIVRDPSRLGLVCPECFARTVEGGRHCVACGIEIRPRQVGSADESLPCPGCGTPLHGVGLEGAVIHECGACGGTWVPAADFDTIVERVAAAAAPRASDALAAPARPTPVRAIERVVYRRCPGCRQIMHRRNFGGSSGIVVDWCRAHGVWFDPDELHAVATFVRSGGLTALPSQETHRPKPTITTAEQGPASSIAEMLIALLT